MTVAPAGFKIWNSMIYTGMPAAFGTRLAQVNGSLYSTASPQPAGNIASVIANINLQRQGTQGNATTEAGGQWGASAALTMIDIEHWQRWPWLTGAADAASAAKYGQALQATKAALGQPIALYDGLPCGGPNQYNLAPPGSAALATLQAHTDAAAAHILPHVDALIPECYWHYDTGPYMPDAKAYWTTFATRKIAEALRVAGGKPVYPIVWPCFHQGGTYQDFRELPVAWWEHVLDTVINSGAQGMILWDAFSLRTGNVISYAGTTRAWAPAVISRSNVQSEPVVQPPPVTPPTTAPARLTIRAAAVVVPPAPTPSPLLGQFVSPAAGYVPMARPANTSRDLMETTDQPYKLGAIAHGWSRDGTVTPGFTLPHQRLLDYAPADGGDGGVGASWALIAKTGRHQYNKARMDEAVLGQGGCPKILPINLVPKWAVSETMKALIRTKYGQENQYGQIFEVSRYPSYPYSAIEPENLEYLREFVRWIYRPTGTLGPGGEAGGGYTVDQVPVLEYGNEQKFAAKTPNAGRYWDYPYAGTRPNAFSLHTMQAFAACLRAIKESAPPGVLVTAGGWEGDSQGRTLSNPTAGLSFFQAAMLSDDGAGGLAIDHNDMVAFHPYMYAYDPARVQLEIDGYRKQLEWMAVHLSRPALATMPIHANETGHQSPTGGDNTYGTGTYIINTQGAAGYEKLAADMRTATLLAVGNASKMKCIGICHYKDSVSRQNYGAPSSNAVLSAASAWGNRIVGQVIRQAYLLDTGHVVAKFESGLILNSSSSTPVALGS